MVSYNAWFYADDIFKSQYRVGNIYLQPNYVEYLVNEEPDGFFDWCLLHGIIAKDCKRVFFEGLQASLAQSKARCREWEPVKFSGEITRFINTRFHLNEESDIEAVLYSRVSKELNG